MSDADRDFVSNADQVFVSDADQEFVNGAFEQAIVPMIDITFCGVHFVVLVFPVVLGSFGSSRKTFTVFSRQSKVATVSS